MTYNEKFNTIKNSVLNNYNNHLINLSKIKELYLQAKKSKDIKKAEVYAQRIQTINNSLNNLKSILNNMRLNNEDDLNERLNIRNNYNRLINEIIPDDIPLVFHGNNNIETVETIIKTGGLLTPDERETDYKSFATQIDVSAKTNINVSLEFADSSVYSFMPYGALFVFLPKEHETENVLKTGDSSEVFGGVESVRLDENRFVGIITTRENIGRLKKVMQDNNFDSNKVFTHEEFLNFSRNKVEDISKQKELLENNKNKYGTSDYVPINIESIDISDISYEQMDNLFFHYGWNKYLKKYDEIGMEAVIGENSEGIDNEKSIFFSKGIEGCLELWDVWLKWRFNRLYNPQYEGKDKEERQRNINRYLNGDISEEERKKWYYWLDYYNNKRFINDEYTLKKLFDFQYNEMENSNYFVLDLKENIEYVENQVDIKKVRAIRNAKNKNRGINPTQLVQYGDYSDFSTTVCDKWNMQTLPGKDVLVEPNRIKRLSCNGKYDVYSIVKSMYDKYNMSVDQEKQVKFDVLDKYIDYVEKNKKQVGNNEQLKENVVVKKRVKDKESNGYVNALIVTLVTGFAGGLFAVLMYFFINK